MLAVKDPKNQGLIPYHNIDDIMQLSYYVPIFFMAHEERWPDDMVLMPKFDLRIAALNTGKPWDIYPRVTLSAGFVLPRGELVGALFRSQYRPVSTTYTDMWYVIFPHVGYIRQDGHTIPAVYFTWTRSDLTPSLSQCFTNKVSNFLRFVRQHKYVVFITMKSVDNNKTLCELPDVQKVFRAYADNVDKAYIEYVVTHLNKEQ